MRRERVAGAAAGVNQLHLMPVVDLPAQALDVDLDEVRLRIEAVVPDMLGDVAAAHDLPLAPRQVLEQGEFLGGELDGAAGTGDAPGPGVDQEVIDRQLAGASAGPRRSSARTRASSSGK